MTLHIDTDLHPDSAHLWYADYFDGFDILHARYHRHAFPKHSHAEYVIGIVEEGFERCLYQGEYVVASPDTLTFINPEVVHTGGSNTSASYRYKAIYPSQALLTRIWQETLGQQGVPYFREATLQDPDAARLMRLLYAAIENNSEALECENLLLQTLVLLLRHNAKVGAFTEVKPHPHNVKDTKDFINAHLSDTLSLDVMARAVGLSPFYLARVFQNSVGLTLHSYLTQQRIDLAKSLIRKGLPLGQVALEVGFYDQSHLNRQFKRYLGITPSQYRTL
ncbi:MAG: AraC family transcriptional regulator [Trueperaceae bacterium]